MLVMLSERLLLRVLLLSGIGISGLRWQHNTTADNVGRLRTSGRELWCGRSRQRLIVVGWSYLDRRRGRDHTRSVLLFVRKGSRKGGRPIAGYHH
uniref:Putative secreted protein n=1 Tax=Anopheles darlingi TaxID=43151 RepID=A0A2M4D3P0_ANODA